MNEARTPHELALSCGTMKIRAAGLEELGKPPVAPDAALAPPKSGEAPVRTKACGVCHTDLYTAS
ncbi:MAG: hypothetical protein R3190_10995, partial [Thermoanaerobaculia bacterium]|nr:hypothetical protein [Thermoanaerobaculia bacterium]